MGKMRLSATAVMFAAMPMERIVKQWGSTTVDAIRVDGTSNNVV